MIDRLKEKFPDIPEKALDLIINNVSLCLMNSICKKGKTFNSRKIIVFGLGVFEIGGLPNAKKQRKKINKYFNKYAKKRNIKIRDSDPLKII